MKKFLIILFILEIVLIFAIGALTLMNNRSSPTGLVIKEMPPGGNASLKILTKAVCNEKSQHVICHDELFIKCKGEEYLITENNFDNFNECNLKLNLSGLEVNGEARFRKEWRDPRKNKSTLDDKVP